MSETYGKSSRTTVVDRYRRNADAFEALTAATPSDRWDSPSPCEGWSAGGVVAHLVELSGNILRDQTGVEPTGAPAAEDDPAGAFRATRRDVERVLENPETSEGVVKHIDAALSFDIAQHWWDLAKATGQDATMDPEFVQTTWGMLSSLPPEWWHWQRNTIHAYGPEVPVLEDAPLQDRLLGLLGRDPNWAPWGVKEAGAKKATPKQTAAKKAGAKQAGTNAEAEVKPRRGEEKAALHYFLGGIQRSLLWKLEGSSDEELRRPLTKTGTNLIGIVKHLIGVTGGYLCGNFGREFEIPWNMEGGGGPDAVEPGFDMWATPEESCDELIAMYRRNCDAGLKTIEELDLDTMGTHHSLGPVSLRWMAYVVLLDTYRHTGHADVVREMIDGRVGSGPGDRMSVQDYDEEHLRMMFARRSGEIDRETWTNYVETRKVVRAKAPAKKKAAPPKKTATVKRSAAREAAVDKRATKDSGAARNATPQDGAAADKRKAAPSG